MCQLINYLADADGNDGDEKDTGKMILAPDIPIEVCDTKKCLTVILQYSRESSLYSLASLSSISHFRILVLDSSVREKRSRNGMARR